jgi:hypothetical protein
MVEAEDVDLPSIAWMMASAFGERTGSSSRS